LNLKVSQCENLVLTIIATPYFLSGDYFRHGAVQDSISQFLLEPLIVEIQRVVIVGKND